MTKFPADADGEALRRVAETSDLSRPMDVDFAVAVPDRVSGHRVADVASSHGYRVSVEVNDETGECTCYCTRHMIASYDAVVAAQKELELLSAPFGGYADGWGTLGNST